MQIMWRLILHVLLASLLGASVHAESLRVTTWNLNWFPSGSPDSRGPELEARLIGEVAASLKELTPDVIILQEVRDWESCERLVQALGGEPYRVLVCSSFNDPSGETSRRQIAMIGRFPLETSWMQEWPTTGWVKPPGGYIFASMRVGAASVGFFGVHFKNNLIQGHFEREQQLNILKRELSAREVLSEVGSFLRSPADAPDALIVGGNFNTSMDAPAFVSEATLRMFHQAGFTNGFEGTPFSARITSSGRGRYPDATFDYVFARNARFIRPPMIASARASDHFPVTCELDVEPKPVLADEDQAAGAFPMGKQRLVILISGIAILGLAFVWFVMLRRRVVLPVELGLPVPQNGSGTAGSMESRIRTAETRADEATAVVKSGLLPYIARLMSDNFVKRLLWQRNHLVVTQNSTAAHVAELEQRLAQLQPKIQSRLDAYEKRIMELEHDLEGAKEHNGNGTNRIHPG